MLRKNDRLLKGKPRGIRWESVIHDRPHGEAVHDTDDIPHEISDDLSYLDDDPDYHDQARGWDMSTVLMAVGSVIGLVLALGVLLTIYTLAAQPEPAPTLPPTFSLADMPVRPVQVLPSPLPSPSPTMRTVTPVPSPTPEPTDTPFPSQVLPTFTQGPTLTFTPAPTHTPGVVFTLGMLFPQTPGSSGGGSSSSSILPSDPILFVRDGELWVISSAGGGLGPLVSSLGVVQGPTWSGDRQQIAFSANVGGNIDVYVMEVSDLSPGRITNDFAPDTDPTWIGSRVAFASTPGGVSDLYSIDSGGNDLRQITDDEALDRQPAASPDGARIVFASNRDGGDFDLFVINADGSGLTQLTADDTDSSHPAWSPDGSRIAYLNGGDIYFVDVQSQEVKPLTDLGSVTGLSWSRDGSRIVFAAGGDLWIVGVTGGTPLPLTAGAGQDSDPAWAR